jgi:hypothetical protein
MEHKCEICEKYYKNYNSLWLHNKKFHKEINNDNKKNEKAKTFKCRNCVNVYKFIQGRWKHEQTCLMKENKENIIELGYEDMSKLTIKEKTNIITCIKFHEYPIVEMVKLIYTTDKYKEYKNVMIPSLKSSYIKHYNGDKGKWEYIDKDKLLNIMIKVRLIDLKTIYKNIKTSQDEKEMILIYLNNFDSENNKIINQHKKDITCIIFNNN